MRRQIRIKKFQLLSSRVEREKLWRDKETLKNSRDFKEITLAITLLAGIGAILFKIVDYFTNNVINESFQGFVNMSVSILLALFFIIFIFLMLKGYLASQKYRNKKIENITEDLFKNIFLLSILLFILLIYTPLDSLFNNIILKVIFVLLFSVLIISMPPYLAYGINLIELLTNRSKEKIPEFQHSIWLFFYGVILIFYLMIFIVPQYLLLGSFSIEELQQSDRNKDMMTIKITETGMTYSSNYIYLYKMNIDTNIFQYIDNITINKTQEALSQNKLMRGIISEPGIWYLNVNTSNLASGNYILQAEVTDDISKKSIFGMVKKHADKLFYIAPRIANYSFNST